MKVPEISYFVSKPSLMRYLRKWVRNVFGFSGNEINGFLILMPILLVLVFSEPLYERWTSIRPRDHAADFRKLDSLASFWDTPKPVNREEVSLPELFAFDPNVASVRDLRRLGFSAVLSNRIAAYRRKGGVFRTKPDLLKIYALDSALYTRLYPYISLPARPLASPEPEKKPASASLSKTSAERGRRRANEVDFDINGADTTVLKAVYGIGPTLAARIVKFRNRLGGFVSPQQLFEVYGLDSIVVDRLLKKCFIESDFVPRKININTVSAFDLSQHPYADQRLARVLVAYRFQHGDFQDVADIKKMSGLNPEEISRLLPYLKVKD